MMSFTRDTASVHKLEPKEKAEEFQYLRKMFIQRGFWETTHLHLP